jgi:hypothetical protein
MNGADARQLALDIRGVNARVKDWTAERVKALDDAAVLSLAV